MEVPDKDIRRAAMDLLARREHSYKELIAKLSLRFSEAQLPEDQLIEVVDVLKAEGLQSDTRFTELFIRSCQSKGYGPMKIKNVSSTHKNLL